MNQSGRKWTCRKGTPGSRSVLHLAPRAWKQTGFTFSRRSPGAQRRFLQPISQAWIDLRGFENCTRFTICGSTFQRPKEESEGGSV